MTGRLVATASEDIEQGLLALLHPAWPFSGAGQGLCTPNPERLLLAPLLAQLQSVYQGHGEVEQCLRSLLEEVRRWVQDRQGYGPTNLVTLLRLLQGHLRGLNLSRLLLRGVYLQSVEMHDANLVRGTASSRAS